MTEAHLPQPFALQAFESIDSTNDEAARQAAGGAPDSTVIWALEQTAGRGRRGRDWVSERGNLFASVLVRPNCGPQHVAEFTFMAANALAEAISNLLPGKAVTCKWPNDVLVDGRKVAGILLEAETTADGVPWLVVGLGVNVHHHPDDGLLYEATDLNGEGALEVRVSGVLETFCMNFQHQRKLWERSGFTPVRETWLKRAHGLGEPIEARLPDRTATGTFQGLDETGALMLESGGTVERILAGDVFPAG